jgi:heptosyltransferase-2
MTERILIVAPSWVGDAILSEPLIALLRERYPGVVVDVLAPSWCGPVYARMRGIGRIIDNPFGHGKLDLAGRRALARSLRAVDPETRYTQAFVLPNSWKSALVPWFAGIPRRTGYRGEARWGFLNDVRRWERKRTPRLVDRFTALVAPKGARITGDAGTCAGRRSHQSHRGGRRAGSAWRSPRCDPLSRRRIWSGQALASHAFRGARGAISR